MSGPQKFPAPFILAFACVMLSGSCERTKSYTGSAGCIEAGATRISYYIDHGAKDEAQRVLLVIGKCASFGMGEGTVRWSRCFDEGSRESGVLTEDRVWMVWEDDTVVPLDVEADKVACMIREWSDGQPVPEALATLIENERIRSR